MTESNVGRWVSVDPAKLVSASTVSGLQVLPSPYDVPVAVRINEGDPQDPAYAVEVRYLGGTEERTEKSHTAADIDLVVGSRSGRVYRLLVDAKQARTGARTRLRDVADAIARLDVYNRDNVQMVSRAVQAVEDELLKQLAALGSVPPGRR